MAKLHQYFSVFSELRVLSIVYNNLDGHISQHITNPTKLYVLDLSNNKFSGRIPMHLERFSSFANVSDDGDLLGDVEIDMKGREYAISYLNPTNIIFDLSCNNITRKNPHKHK